MGGSFANCRRQPEGKLPNHHWSCIFERGHTSMYQRACKNSYYLAGIVTTEHLHKNHHKSIMKCSCSVSLTDVLHVSGKVWFGLRLLMQFQNKIIKTTVSSNEGKHSVVNLFLQCGNHACRGLWSIILTRGYSLRTRVGYFYITLMSTMLWLIIVYFA